MSKAGQYRVEVGPEVGGEAVDEEAENVQAVLGHLGEGRGQALRQGSWIVMTLKVSLD